MTSIEQIATLATFGAVWSVLSVGHNLANHVIGQAQCPPPLPRPRRPRSWKRSSIRSLPHPNTSPPPARPRTRGDRLGAGSLDTASRACTSDPRGYATGPRTT